LLLVFLPIELLAGGERSKGYSFEGLHQEFSGLGCAAAWWRSGTVMKEKGISWTAGAVRASRKGLPPVLAGDCPGVPRLGCWASAAQARKGVAVVCRWEEKKKEKDRICWDYDQVVRICRI